MKKNSKVTKNISVSSVAKFKRSNYSVAMNKLSPKNKNDRKTNKLITTSSTGNNNSSSATDQQFIVTHQHVEVYTEQMTREVKLKKPPKPGVSTGKPGQHH